MVHTIHVCRMNGGVFPGELDGSSSEEEEEEEKRPVMRLRPITTLGTRRAQRAPTNRDLAIGRCVAHVTRGALADVPFEVGKIVDTNDQTGRVCTLSLPSCRVVVCGISSEVCVCMC